MMMDLSGIDYLGINRVLKRGTGEIIEDRAGALLVRDTVSDACFLACECPSTGLSVLDRHASRGIDLLMVANAALGRIAFERYGFSEGFECFQVAYFGERPVAESILTVREADRDDLPRLIECYDLISPEEMAMVVDRKSLLLGYVGNRLAGFIGEHLEGSMGLLYVFPEFRRRGLGAALEKRYIARTMDQGFVPFGQVKKDNTASLMLQKKLGMTQSENLTWWMWR